MLTRGKREKSMTGDGSRLPKNPSYEFYAIARRPPRYELLREKEFREFSAGRSRYEH
jgi:hypothetical protein